jgi:hypothetical protein
LPCSPHDHLYARVRQPSGTLHFRMTMPFLPPSRQRRL